MWPKRYAEMRPYAKFRIQRTGFCICVSAKTVPANTETWSFFKEQYLEQNSALWSQTELCFHIGFCNMTTFFSYSAVNTTFKHFTICILRKALLRSQTHQRDRAFSQVKKPVRLTCPEILRNVRLTLKGKQKCTLLSCFDCGHLNSPCLQCVGRQDFCLIPFLSAMRWKILPQVLQNMPSFW